MAARTPSRSSAVLPIIWARSGGRRQRPFGRGACTTPAPAFPGCRPARLAVPSADSRPLPRSREGTAFGRYRNPSSRRCRWRQRHRGVTAVQNRPQQPPRFDRARLDQGRHEDLAGRQPDAQLGQRLPVGLAEAADQQLQPRTGQAAQQLGQLERQTARWSRQLGFTQTEQGRQPVLDEGFDPAGKSGPHLVALGRIRTGRRAAAPPKAPGSMGRLPAGRQDGPARTARRRGAGSMVSSAACSSSRTRRPISSFRARRAALMKARTSSSRTSGSSVK